MTMSTLQRIQTKRGAYKRKRRKKIARMKANGHVFTHGTGKAQRKTRSRINILPMQLMKEAQQNQNKKDAKKPGVMQRVGNFLKGQTKT